MSTSVTNTVMTAQLPDEIARPLFDAIAARMGDLSKTAKYETYKIGYKYRRDLKYRSVADIMEQYITDAVLRDKSESIQRERLMRFLFAQNNLTYTPDVMPIYHNWLKTFDIPPRTNRYNRMRMFIEALGALFTKFTTYTSAEYLWR
jgi:hypothetical protein